MPQLRLYALPYSPWSECARWALDHHGIDYREIEHAPFLGEPRLRIAARKWRGRVSVPILLTPHGAITDSFEIAAFADRIGRRAPLGFADHRDELARWNDRSHSLLANSCSTTLERLLASPAALDEASPSWMPHIVRPAIRPIARSITRYVQRKYGAFVTDGQALLTSMRESLDALQAALEGGRRFIFDTFSYADILMAVSLQSVDPVDDRHLRVGASARAVWRNETLAHEYKNLLAWRDAMYEEHRR
jgi:glutathione S-transferase